MKEGDEILYDGKIYVVQAGRLLEKDIILKEKEG